MRAFEDLFIDSDPPDSGGGATGTPTGGGGAAVFTPALPLAAEHGGVIGTTWYLLVPVQDIRTGICYFGIYDTEDYNDTIDGSNYSYRVEDVIKHKQPTVNEIILIYRDMGKAKLTASVNVMNDDGVNITVEKTESIGTADASGNLITKRIYLEATGYQPQLTLIRNAAEGPVSIISSTMKGMVED